MLALSRYTDQTIFIGDNITVTIGHVGSGGKVKVLIEAPKEVRIVRGELLDGTKGEDGARFGGKGPKPRRKADKPAA